MIKRSRVLVACSVVAFAAVCAQAWAEGNAAAGKQKNRLCQGCHGIADFRTAYPDVYNVPKLGGQGAPYMVKALQDYKSGARKHPSMNGIAASLSDQDMADLAAYYASSDSAN
jgi:cytochrome c553